MHVIRTWLEEFLILSFWGCLAVLLGGTRAGFGGGLIFFLPVKLCSSGSSTDMLWGYSTRAFGNMNYSWLWVTSGVVSASVGCFSHQPRAVSSHWHWWGGHSAWGSPTRLCGPLELALCCPLSHTLLREPEVPWPPQTPKQEDFWTLLGFPLPFTLNIKVIWGIHRA